MNETNMNTIIQKYTYYVTIIMSVSIIIGYFLYFYFGISIILNSDNASQLFLTDNYYNVYEYNAISLFISFVSIVFFLPDIVYHIYTIRNVLRIYYKLITELHTLCATIILKMLTDLALFSWAIYIYSKVIHGNDETIKYYNLHNNTLLLFLFCFFSGIIKFIIYLYLICTKIYVIYYRS
jgi:hypothetical protein